MHDKQRRINQRWEADGLPPFGLGLGLSTGEAAAALLGSEERLEYTLVGDTVNMSQRLQQLAEAGETVVSRATVEAWHVRRATVALPPQLVKGRESNVVAFKLAEGPCGPHAHTREEDGGA
jgi:class 3 adenylate cyclase